MFKSQEGCDLTRLFLELCRLTGTNTSRNTAAKSLALLRGSSETPTRDRGRKMRRSFLAVTWLSCALLLALCREAVAQGVVRTTENLDSERPEAWAMNYFTSVSLLAGLDTPHSREPGSIEL